MATAMARAAPTRAASRTRGSRSWNRMTAIGSGMPAGRPVRPTFQANSRSVVPGEIHTAPKATASTTDASRTAARTGMATRARLGVLISRERLRVEQPGQLSQPLNHPGPGPAHQIGVHQVDLAVANGGDGGET